MTGALIGLTGGVVTGAVAAAAAADTLGEGTAQVVGGGAAGGAGQVASNLQQGRPWSAGVAQAVGVGIVSAGVFEGAGAAWGALTEGVAAEGAAEGATGVGAEADANGADVCAGSLSFSADTLVATPQGEQPIASLQVGDHVTSYDPTTGQATTQTITHVYLNHDTDRLDVTLTLPASKDVPHTQTTAQDATTAREQRTLVMSHGRRGPPDTATAAAATSSASAASADETIHTTANHPWLTADHGWLEAGQLHAG